MRIKFLLSCFIILLIFIFSIYLNSSKKEVKGVQTMEKTNLFKPSMSPTPMPTTTPISNSQPVVKKPPEKVIGGWYWNSELNKAQRWMGKDSQNNDIWSDQGDPPPAAQNSSLASSGSSDSSSTSQQSSSNNSASLPPSELGATPTPQQLGISSSQTSIGVSVSVQGKKN